MFFADFLGPTFPTNTGKQLYRYVVEKVGKKDTATRDELRKIVGAFLKQTNDPLPVDAAIGYLLTGGRLVRLDTKSYRIVKM